MLRSKEFHSDISNKVLAIIGINGLHPTNLLLLPEIWGLNQVF